MALGPDRLDEDVEELAPGERIEAGERLVEEQDPGPRPEGEGEPDLGLLAAGQLRRQRPSAGSTAARRSGRRAPASKPSRSVVARVMCSAIVRLP